FKPEVTIKSDTAGKHSHVFHCANRGCRTKIARWLDKGDKGSTGNMRKHIKACWGEEALGAADQMKMAEEARPAVEKFTQSGSIMASFERKGKGKVMYSSCQHSWQEASLRLFTIVEDWAFQSLMKMGRPEYWIPSRWTVARDVHKVFARCHARVTKMLQEFDGELNFATDAWTSPNNKAIVAFTVHLHHKGVPLHMVLDIIEVAEAHNGVNLATVFAKMTEDFNITMKVSP
ncbi:hypothetical protein BKA93DRAFT_741171, partial [Sparassis latifolia]